MTTQPEFVRVRVRSARSAASVTAEIACEAFGTVSPDAVALACSQPGHGVNFIGRPSGDLPTFIVTATGDAEQTEPVLRSIAETLEACYDTASGELVVR